MSKRESIKYNIFGLNPNRSDSLVVIIPVPWEVTTSYGSGTSQGPKAVLAASPQLDLFDRELGSAYKAGYFLESESPKIRAANKRLKALAQNVIASCDENGIPSSKSAKKIDDINSGSEQMVKFVNEEAQKILAEKKIPAVLGGDHSTPLGLIQAICDKHRGDVGILHIDAHADLRLAYQGFTHSHASIMRNVMNLKTPPKKLVQVAIRDFCEEEFNFIESQQNKIHTHFDLDLKKRMFAGQSWQKICEDIVSDLPQNVYVSFDIDGLSPEFCPHTGTPVPGGLSFDQATHLLSVLGHSGRKVTGFDLNEVAPGKDNEWDANVGARILYKLCGWAVKTNS